MRLATYKLIVSVDAVVGVELLATTLAGKHIATVLPNFVLAKYLQSLEIFVTDITGVNPLYLLCFVPPHVQIEDDLLNSGPCPTWRSGKNSSRGEACHTQAYCVC